MKFISKSTTPHGVEQTVVETPSGSRYRRDYCADSFQVSWFRSWLQSNGERWTQVWNAAPFLEESFRLMTNRRLATTIKVRIPVAVSSSGDWCAGGCADHTDAASSQYALENLQDGEARTVYWLTAELPVPQTAEIPVKVEPNL